MTFLNAALLFALTLGLLPILIHLLTRQRLKRIPFPTLRFLKELQRQRMRQLKLRQLLLLLLRTLAVIALVLAFARPVVRSSPAVLPGVHARTSVLLVVDRSASMETETLEGTRFREMAARAQEILSLLEEGDDAQIIWADAAPVLYPPEPTSQFRILREMLSEARATAGGSDLAEALRLARSRILQSKNLHREVYVLSDFSVSAWPNGLPDGPLFPEEVKLFLLPAGEARFRNAGIVGIRILSRLITPGRPVEVEVTLKNSSADALPERLVSLFLEGRRVASQAVSFGPLETKTLELRFVPEQAGNLGGYARLEAGDDLPLDDERYFVLKVPEKVRVGLVAPAGSAATYTSLALNPSGSAEAFVQAEMLSPDAFETADWTLYDALFLVDAPALGAGIGARLRAFVESGKGVFVMLGSNADLRAHNNWLLDLGLPTLGDVWTQEGASTQWAQVDWMHPLFEGLFEEAPKSVSPTMTRLVRILGGNATTIISTGVELPFLVESRAGRGHAILLTGSAEPAWSNLYRTGIFSPLMVRLAAYLSGTAEGGDAFQLVVGQSSTIQRLGIAPTAPAELTSETGSFQIIPRAIPAGFEYPIPSLGECGIYRLSQDDREILRLAASVPSIETDIGPLSIENPSKFWGGKTAKTVKSSNLSEAILESRFGRELWKTFLLIALLCLAAEMFLGRAGKAEQT
ncbi:MAG: BatA domain-containing protein [bacterium]